MVVNITFAFTVLCIVTMLMYCMRDVFGETTKYLWVLFLVSAVAFSWLFALDLMKSSGISQLASSEWRALVFRGSIGVTALGVLIVNGVKYATRHRGHTANRGHDKQEDHRGT